MDRHRRRKQRIYLTIMSAILALALLPAGRALASSFVGSDVYRLESDQVINDDLYVSASEIYIDGTVNGDLFATGGYVEVAGTVTGDAMLVGAGIVVSGDVQDDLRTAGAGIDVSGTVGDDLLVAGGGNPNFSFPIQTQGHTIMQGVRLTDSATVGGDATILGGVGQIASAIDGNLIAAMADVSLNGHVSGNAQVNAGALALGDAAQIDGDLNYQTEQRIDTAGVVGGTVGYQPPTPTSAPDPIAVWIDRLTRAALALLGFAALGWLLLRLAPRSLSDPAEAISAR
ncbi:hypothetical protein EKD04_025230, partial [Chloroflexales bacterium ZM16-3]|nr:hypothetical protein [Chloroflexales bacterium ZM16-3]